MNFKNLPVPDTPRQFYRCAKYQSSTRLAQRIYDESNTTHFESTSFTKRDGLWVRDPLPSALHTISALSVMYLITLLYHFL